MSSKRILAVVTTAYRATLEEQDDPVLWLAHSLRGAGTEIDVLLQGPAVNYGVKGQDASGLAFGGRAQTQPPRLAEDLEALAGKGARLYYVEEDARALGLRADELLEGVRPLPARAVPGLFGEYTQVWRW